MENEIPKTYTDLNSMALWLTLVATLQDDGEYVRLKTDEFAKQANQMLKLLMELQSARRKLNAVV